MSHNQRGPIPQGITVPVMPISPGDIAVIAEIMSSYLAFVRFSYRPSAQRETYLQDIESLRQRLTGRHQENTPISLTREDIETIEAAMSTFEVIRCRWHHQPESVMPPLLRTPACVNALRPCALVQRLTAL